MVDAEKSARTTDSLVGKVLHDRFRIVAPIARGGMGAVYKAEQAPLGRLVALKVLSPKHDEAQDPEFRRRFLLEAATVAKLSHPNTVTVFDYGQSDGLYFIVMELLDGLTLRAVLKRDGAFDAARTVHVTKQICRSLREAHRLGIVHRDMKPGNVVLLEQGDEQDYVKVLDFGLVKDLEANEDEDLTQAGVFMGSPKYMAPEQIQGGSVDGRSDIYSVGVLMYEMLTGAPPFVREKQVQILMDHINAPVPPLPAHVPAELAQIVGTCLAKDPSARFADMDALLSALKVAAGELALPSGELGVSGELSLPPTPVSGVHSLPADALARNSSISAPVVASPSITPSNVSAPASLDAPRGRGARAAVIALGALVAVLAVTIAVMANDPDAEPVATPEPAPAAQAPVVEAPAPAAPEPPPVLRTVIVELDSRPSGATVELGDREYGPTPTHIELTGAEAEPGAALRFVFSLDGHRDATVEETVPADGPLEVHARLRRVRRPPRRPPRQADDPPAQTVTPAGYRESPY